MPSSPAADPVSTIVEGDIENSPPPVVLAAAVVPALTACHSPNPPLGASSSSSSLRHATPLPPPKRFFARCLEWRQAQKARTATRKATERPVARPAMSSVVRPLWDGVGGVGLEEGAGAAWMIVKMEESM